MAKRDLILLAMNASPTLDLLARALRASDFEVATAQDQVGMDKLIHQSIPALMIIGNFTSGTMALGLRRCIGNKYLPFTNGFTLAMSS